VVETNIMRSATAATRDAPAVRANGGDTLPRAMPLPDATHWPLQPEPTAAAVAVPNTRPERVHTDDAAQWPTQIEPTPASPPGPAVRVQRDALAGLAADLAQPAPAAPARPAQPVLARAAAPKPTAPAVQIDPQTAATNDQNLANMAHQLEAALRRPVEAARPAEQKRIEPKLAPRPAPTAAVAAAGAVPTAAQQKPFESIEQEMASLLGRPGKP
jgi:hypothetical protein